MLAMRRIDLRNRPDKERPWPSALDVPRPTFDVRSVLPAASQLSEAVRERGDAAVRDARRRYDDVDSTPLRVPADAFESALASASPEELSVLEEAEKRLRRASQSELRRRTSTEMGHGARVVQRNVPIDRAGIYIRRSSSSALLSVLASVVPAQVAGVPSIALAAPPEASSGLPHRRVLAACGFLGVDEVYAVGGSAAIPMFTHGTESCRPAKVIAGRGNERTTAAKWVAALEVAVDPEGGHGELLVLADRWSDANFIAADLVSRAARDPHGSLVLVTPTDWFADDVEKQIERHLDRTGARESLRAVLASPNSAIVLVDDMEDGIEVVNHYSPQFLEIHSVYAWSYADRIRNAGAVYVGPFSPVGTAHYRSGPGTVVPAGGWADRSSALSVRTFQRTMHVVDYTRDALEENLGVTATWAALDNRAVDAEALVTRFEASWARVRAAIEEEGVPEGAVPEDYADAYRYW
ncbi:histidinol dehydrogenase [Nocardia pseudovaccinii]|uniref:histidinol dehydrogenase n=1 Tax=Nocardia pseudovaccinii TaxID=189540 RepID=UPI003D949EAF